MRFKIPQRQPESFRASALYLAGRVKGLSPDRVEFIERRNLHTDDPRAAAAIMDATAQKSPRCKQPAYHFIITFDPKDAAAGKVTPEVKRLVAQQVIERMGLTEHQLLVYSHKDTEHPHMHFLVNRVHPTQHIAFNRHQDGRKLTGIVQELALELGLNVLRHRDHERQLDREVVEDFGPSASDAEYWRARREEREAQLPFGKDAVADLRRRLKDDFIRAQGWDDLAERLAGKGITLERKGQGLILTDGERFAKLSEMGKGVRFLVLEQRFGESFDDHMARQAARVTQRDRGRGDAIPDTAGMAPADRRTVQGMFDEEPDRDPAENAVQRLDEADMDFRYWSQIEASYRSAAGKVRYAERQKSFSEKQVHRDEAWLRKRSESLNEILGKVYRDAVQARALWDELEQKFGIRDAEHMIEKDPFILGAVRGTWLADTRTAALREAKRYRRYIVERRRRWRDAQNRLAHTRAETERARQRLKLAVRDFELLQHVAGTPQMLREIVLEKVKTRARALARVTERAIARSRLSEERREQLHRVWRLAKERKLERERKHERGRAFGRSLDPFGNS